MEIYLEILGKSKKFRKSIDKNMKTVYNVMDLKNIYNHIKKRMYCEEKGIKYLHGVECYVTETFDEKTRDNYHTILIAKNDDGMVELNTLLGCTTDNMGDFTDINHVYYKPRISFDEFINDFENEEERDSFIISS